MRLEDFFRFSYVLLISQSLLPIIKAQQMIRDAVEQTPLDTKEDLAYIRIIFANGTEQYVRNWECPDGLWSEEMFAIKQQPRCLCVKGVFAISKELCDEAFEIITGNEHCYDIGNTKIRKITPLTGQGGLNGRANTVFRKDGAYFARLISPTPTSRVLEPVDYIFRLNDPNDFSIYTTASSQGHALRLGCLKGQTGASNDSQIYGKQATNKTITNPIMQIAALPSCANEFRGPQTWCQATQTSNYLATLKIGSKWSPKGGAGSGSPYPGACKALSGRSGRRTGRKKRDTRGNSKASDMPASSPSYCSSLINSSTLDPEQVDPPQIGATSAIEYFVDRSPFPIRRDFKTWENYQNEVNEQTQKIMRNILDFHLGQIEDRNDTKIKIQNPSRIDAFRYVQLSRTIIEKVCPQEQVPTFVLAFMIRLFRIILLDLQERYKYSEFLRANSSLNNDILKTLTECKEGAKPYFFMQNETCPSQGYYGTNDSSNATNIFFDNINLTMPTDVKWQPGAVDFPLETVWKMMVFVHYYCASYFPSPVLHSQFVVKYEAFFNNPTALFRWYNPGPANKLIRTLLPSYDLSAFASAIDRCVSTAREISQYKGWLRRPADGLAFFLKKFDIEKFTTKDPLANDAPLKRSKRYFAQNNIWQGQAYCLRNTKSIQTDVRSSSIFQCKTRPQWFQNTDYYFY